MMSGRIFLSASMPPTEVSKLRLRPDAWEDLYLGFPTQPKEVERAVVEIVPHLLQQEELTLVFGGHPTISPIIADLARHRTTNARIEIYQSAFFAGQEPFQQRNDEHLYDLIQWTPICKPDASGPVPLTDPFRPGEHPLRSKSQAAQQHRDVVEQLKTMNHEELNEILAASLLYMRRLMIKDCSAAILIGGMKGIADELDEFERLNPTSKAWLVTRPGGRTARIAVAEPANGKNRSIENELAYESIGIKLARELSQAAHRAVPSRVEKIATSTSKAGKAMSSVQNSEQAAQSQKLRNMLSQVAVENDLEGLKSGLESTLDAERMESVTTGLNDLREGKEITPDQQYALEAIVLPRERPVLYITNDTYRDPPPKWRHLLNPDIKERLQAAIPSIGRIEVPHHSFVPYAGTGFVVGHNLLMTNRHVAELFTTGVGLQSLTFITGQTAAIDFKQEVIPNEPVIQLEIARVVLIHPYWDMALLEVKGLSDSHTPLKLSVTHPDDLLDQDIAVIGYPARDSRNDSNLQNEIFGGVFNVKRLQPGKLRKRAPQESYGKNVLAVTHDSSTLGGNSGSAVINLNTGEIVGLHFAGRYLEANYAVPTFELARDPRVLKHEMNFIGSVETTSEWESFWKLSATAETTTVAVPTLPAPPQEPHKVTFTMPLQFTISIGTPTTSGAGGLTTSVDLSTASPGAAPITSEGLFGGGADDNAVQEAYNRFNRSSLETDEFSYEAALAGAVLSQLSYRNASEVQNTLTNRFGFSTARFIDNGSTQSFIASTPNVVVVCFRGTESTRDWITNLRTFSTNASFGRVHSGFFYAFSSVRETLEELMDPLTANNRSVVLVGHSLGGALATIAAASWQARYHLRGIYTYGQPRAGLEDFRTFADQKFSTIMHRFVNNDDIVPTVPPGYSHVGRLIRFAADGSIRSRDTESAVTDSSLSEAQFAALQQSLRTAIDRNTTMLSGLESLPMVSSSEAAGAGVESMFTLFSDHGMDRYMRQVLRQL